MRITINPAQTTSTFLKRERVGAALITARDDTCAIAETFILSTRVVIATPVGFVRGAIVTTPGGRGVPVAGGGSAAGIYEASLRAARGLAGRIQFKVAAQETTEAAIEAPRVTVSGLATLNDRTAA